MEILIYILNELTIEEKIEKKIEELIAIYREAMNEKEKTNNYDREAHTKIKESEVVIQSEETNAFTKIDKLEEVFKKVIKNRDNSKYHEIKTKIKMNEALIKINDLSDLYIKKLAEKNIVVKSVETEKKLYESKDLERYCMIYILKTLIKIYESVKLYSEAQKKKLIAYSIVREQIQTIQSAEVDVLGEKLEQFKKTLNEALTIIDKSIALDNKGFEYLTQSQINVYQAQIKLYQSINRDTNTETA